MKGQKEAVIEIIMMVVPGFVKYQDNALLKLDKGDLEAVKNIVTDEISNGLIEYSKDRTNKAEVRSYARSMVMNHIKKAKELNGGHSYISNSSSSGTSTSPVVRVKAKIAPKGVNPDLLPEDLKEFVKTLV